MSKDISQVRWWYVILQPPIMKLERRKKAEAIAKKLISRYLITEYPELSETYGLVTVTGVEISSELSYIDIYVSALKDKETLTKTLAEYAHSIHRLLAKNIELVKVPKVRFRYDESGETLWEISHIISNLDKSS